MTNADYTHLCLIVDRSGSMNSIASDMNGAITNLLEQQDKEPGKLLIDIVTFDDAIEVPYSDVSASTVKGDVIMPRGMTALNDAVGVTIKRMGNKFALMAEDDRPGTVIIVVVTDGMENASKEYTSDQIKALVTEQTDTWNWTFMYLAANVDAFATGGAMGFARGQTISYAATAGSTQSVYDSVGASTTRVRKGGSADFTQEERDAAAEAS